MPILDGWVINYNWVMSNLAGWVVNYNSVMHIMAGWAVNYNSVIYAHSGRWVINYNWVMHILARWWVIYYNWVNSWVVRRVLLLLLFFCIPFFLVTFPPFMNQVLPVRFLSRGRLMCVTARVTLIYWWPFFSLFVLHFFLSLYYDSFSNEWCDSSTGIRTVYWTIKGEGLLSICNVVQCSLGMTEYHWVHISISVGR